MLESISDDLLLIKIPFHSQIRLIVIDSFSYLFRISFPEDINKVQTIYGILDDLQELAEEFECAVSDI